MAAKATPKDQPTIKHLVKAMTESLPEKQQEIINLLTRKGALTAKALSQLTGRNDINVRRSLLRLKAKGLAHISGYADRVYQNCLHSAEWDLGNWPDVPRPKAKTNKQKKKDYRIRNAALHKINRNPESYQSLGVWRGLA